jgi:hypothetical protein
MHPAHRLQRRDVAAATHSGRQLHTGIAHVRRPTNARLKERLAAAPPLLDSVELRTAAQRLHAVTDITPDMLEAMHTHQIEEAEIARAHFCTRKRCFVWHQVGDSVTLRQDVEQRGPLALGRVGTLVEDDGSSIPYKCEFEGVSYWYKAADIVAAGAEGTRAAGVALARGDRVRVIPDADRARALADGFGGWNTDMAEYCGTEGTVQTVSRFADVRHEDGQEWAWNPEALEFLSSSWSPSDIGLGRTRRALAEWLGIHRGSDLFVRGLGRFDIGRNSAFTPFQVHRVHPSLGACYSTSDGRNVGYAKHCTWMLRPVQLQANAYFPEVPPDAREHIVLILELPCGHCVRRHMIRFYAWWKQPQHASMLHELIKAAERLAQLDVVRSVGGKRQQLLVEAGITDITMLARLSSDEQERVAKDTPGISTLLLGTLAQNAAQELPRWWPVDIGEDAQPLTLLGSLRKLQEARDIENDYYKHLDSLADMGVEDGDGMLRILRSKAAVRDVAERLRNCAASYAAQVRAGKYLLVGLQCPTRGWEALAGLKLWDDLKGLEPCLLDEGDMERYLDEGVMEEGYMHILSTMHEPRTMQQFAVEGRCATGDLFLEDPNEVATLALEMLVDPQSELYDPASLIPTFNDFGGWNQVVLHCNTKACRETIAKFRPALDAAVRWQVERLLAADAANSGEMMYQSVQKFVRLYYHSVAHRVEGVARDQAFLLCRLDGRLLDMQALVRLAQTRPPTRAFSDIEEVSADSWLRNAKYVQQRYSMYSK